MADLGDILGKKSNDSEDMNNRIELDGMCETCYWSLDHGYYDPKYKKLKIYCINGHESTIDWDMGNG